MKQQFHKLGQFLLPLVIVGVSWELLALLGAVNIKTVPTPSTILREMFVLVYKKQILQWHLYHSFYRLGCGYALAVLTGVVVGTLLALNRVLRDMFSPVLSLLISIPTIAWVPVLLITMGLGDKTVITAIFLGGVFEITYSTVAGIRSVNPREVDAARIMGIQGLSLVYKVLLPGALVSVMPALRLSIGYCWRALVGAEMLSAMIRWGIGKMIYEARFWNDVKVMFVGLIVIGIFAVVLDRMVLKQLEHETIEKWGMVAKR